ncbi:MAG: hypothetical protein J6W36_04680 [Clostridiales bacterium]|nr:hypothetical protein [Clostridiales bacterium]
MRFFIKLTAVAMSAAIVFGCGATLNASETRYNIDEYFTDPAFNSYVRQYDSNKDGYLTDSEMSGMVQLVEYDGIEKHLVITGATIKNLDGIEILPAVDDLSILGISAGKIDLTCVKAKQVIIYKCESLKTFVCGDYQDNVYISACPNLKKTFFNYAKNLEILGFDHCPLLEGSLSLENAPKLKDLAINRTGFKNIYCSDSAPIERLWIMQTPLRNLEILGATTKINIQIKTNKTLANIFTSGELARLLWEGGLFVNDYINYRVWNSNHSGYETFISIDNRG